MRPNGGKIRDDAVDSDKKAAREQAQHQDHDENYQMGHGTVRGLS
jgi:hypothetical protein